MRLTDAVLSRAWMAPDRLYEGLAFHFDLPFVDLVHEAPDAALLRAEDADFYARSLMMPWRRREGRIVIATANPGPETVLAARRRWGAAIEFVVSHEIRHRMGGAEPHSILRSRIRQSLSSRSATRCCRRARCLRRRSSCSFSLC